MKKNVLSAMFGLGVILISLFLLTAYRSDVKSAPAAETSANHVPVVVDPADRKFSYAAYYVSAEVEAADLLAARWQAMGEFYEEQDMLTRDNFDYEQAADLSAARWQAMAEFYEEQVSAINYAMDPVNLKLFNSAETSPTSVAIKGTGISYAMDPVNLKLFNSAETSPTSVATKGPGISYAMDPVDLKLFNSAETSPTSVVVD